MFLSPKNITFLLASFFVIQIFSQSVDEEVTQLSEVVLTGQSPIKQVQKAAYNVVAIEAQQLRNLNSNAADMLARVSGVKMREIGGVFKVKFPPRPDNSL